MVIPFFLGCVVSGFVLVHVGDADFEVRRMHFRHAIVIFSGRRLRTSHTRNSTWQVNGRKSR